jgi:hypothetical protein
MRKNLLQYSIKFAIIATILFASNVSASACWPYFSTFGGWNGYYSTCSQESVPYYALNPPVYYSYPVARTYGLYPFPYYAETTYSPSVSVEPRLVVNKYVEQKLATKSEEISRRPLRISNPFVEQEGTNAVQQVSWDESKKAKPMVIHPIELTNNK